jgi:oxygen-independent coproporphyrinogen-3 oxidase
MPALPVATSSLPLCVAQLPAAAIHGLYVHIPFCFHKCHYCDFYSITRQDASRMARFVDLIGVEARLWASDRRRSVRPQTIFFGGGTPSLLPLDQMRRLIRILGEAFDLSQIREFTVEANPATVTPEYCRMLRDAGVDRLSFGAQSFDRTDLAMLERHHDPQDVPRSVQIARAAGFGRINIDLIYAIPGQSLASWSGSLEAAIALELDHYSCYGLTYEPNTPMAVRKRLGQFRAADEDLELSMMHRARHRLREIGCPAYEISNYARPGHECLHNLVYWTGGNYIGLGPSAASHIEGHRFKNRAHLGEWETAIAGAQLPASDVEVLSPPRRAGELAMLMLRLSRGLDFSKFAAHTGFDAPHFFREPLDRLSRVGLICMDAAGARLSETGVNVADAVAAEFLAAAGV